MVPEFVGRGKGSANADISFLSNEVGRDHETASEACRFMTILVTFHSEIAWLPSENNT